MMLHDKVAVIYGAGSAIGGAVARGRAGSYASAQAFTNGFAPAIGASAAFALAGAITGLALPSRRGAATAAPTQQARLGARARR